MDEEEPNATITMGNMTYCWFSEIQAYSWCPKDPEANRVDKGTMYMFKTL